MCAAVLLIATHVHLHGGLADGAGLPDERVEAGVDLQLAVDKSGRLELSSARQSRLNAQISQEVVFSRDTRKHLGRVAFLTGNGDGTVSWGGEDAGVSVKETNNQLASTHIAHHHLETHG